MSKWIVNYKSSFRLHKSKNKNQLFLIFAHFSSLNKLIKSCLIDMMVSFDIYIPFVGNAQQHSESQIKKKWKFVNIFTKKIKNGFSLQ
jgi:hypothetical protein